MTGLRVHHLDCAHLGGGSLGGRPLTCHVLLVETPASGLVLVDSGLGTADYADMQDRQGRAFVRLIGRPLIDPSLAAINQIRALGFDPHDVRHIVQTHLDLDHVGGLSDFPWATVHVHATELEAATVRAGMRDRARYRPALWSHQPTWRTYSQEGEPWLGFSAVRSLAGLPHEILAVPLPGHTAGHCGVAVDSEDGWMLAAGDAFFDPREVQGARRQCQLPLRLFQALVTADRREREENQRRLRQLVRERPDVRVFCAHDPWHGRRFSVPEAAAQADGSEVRRLNP